jgi:hypothetical protein
LVCISRRGLVFIYLVLSCQVLDVRMGKHYRMQTSNPTTKKERKEI